MLRRDFLQTGAAGAGAACRPPPPPKAKITSSVMLWTLKGTFEEKLEMAARGGISIGGTGRRTRRLDRRRLARAMKQRRSFKLGMDTLIATPDWAKRPVSMVDPAQRDGFLADVRNGDRLRQ